MKQKWNKQQLIWWPVEFKVFDACSGSNLKSKYTRRQKGTVQLKYASYWARSPMTSSRSSGVKKAKVWEVWLSVSFWVILENHQMTEDRETASLSSFLPTLMQRDVWDGRKGFSILQKQWTHFQDHQLCCITWKLGVMVLNWQTFKQGAPKTVYQL